MPGFRLSVKAREDLKSIGRYTEKTWGRDQRNQYLASLDSAFRALATEPQKGLACDDIRAGYRKYRVGRHYIFYRTGPGGVDIIRILHERMDVGSHLEYKPWEGKP